jgi:hypothetical protein
LDAEYRNESGGEPKPAEDQNEEGRNLRAHFKIVTNIVGYRFL